MALFPISPGAAAAALEPPTPENVSICIGPAVLAWRKAAIEERRSRHADIRPDAAAFGQ